MRVRISAAALAAAGLCAATAAQAGGFTILHGTSDQEASLQTGGGESGGTFSDQSWSTFGSHSFSTSEGSASLKTGLGGGSAQVELSGRSRGSAGASITYEYVFTAKSSDTIVSLLRKSYVVPIACTGANPGPCQTPSPVPPDYYIADATKITGAYDMSFSGYGDADVNAYGFGPEGSPTSFDATCGYSTLGSGLCNGDNPEASGTFSMYGVLMADSASLAANSFYGFLTISASARLLEGGDISAMIDPMVSLNLDGVNPDDFTLTLSPGFDNGAGGGTGGVPEPATWGLMLAGFGLAGAALRRRRALA